MIFTKPRATISVTRGISGKKSTANKSWRPQRRVGWFCRSLMGQPDMWPGHLNAFMLVTCHSRKEHRHQAGPT